MTIGEAIEKLAAEHDSTIKAYILAEALKRVVGGTGPVEIGGKLYTDWPKYEEMDKAEQKMLAEIKQDIGGK